MDLACSKANRKLQQMSPLAEMVKKKKKKNTKKNTQKKQQEQKNF